MEMKGAALFFFGEAVDNGILHQRLEREGWDENAVLIYIYPFAVVDPASEANLLDIQVVLYDLELPGQYDFIFRSLQVIAQKAAHTGDHFFCCCGLLELSHTGDGVQCVEKEMGIDLAFEHFQPGCLQGLFCVYPLQFFAVQAFRHFLFFTQRRDIAGSGVFHKIEGVDQLETYFGAYLPQFFYAMLAPLTLFIVLSFISLPAAILLFCCVPLIPAAIIAVQRWAKKLLSKYWGQYTALGDTFLENLQGLTTLKIYQADAFKQEEMDRESERFRKITMKVLTMQLNSITIMDLIAYGGAAAGIIMAVTQYAAGNVDLAGCLFIILLSLTSSFRCVCSVRFFISQ